MKSRPAAALRDRPEGVVERLGHRRVAVAGVLGVHVEVARVPARLAAGGALVVAGRLVGLVGEGRVVGEARSPRASRPCRRRRPPPDAITAATPSSAAHRPGRIGPGRKARVVLPGGSTRGLAVYSASVEKPSAESVTSRWLEPPQPRNSRGPQTRVAPSARGSYRPRSSVWRLRARLRAVPAVLDADRGRAARDLERHHHVALAEARAELARDHRSGAIARPVHGVVSGAACAGTAGTSRTSAATTGTECAEHARESITARPRRMRQERELAAQHELGGVDRAMVPARRPRQQRDRAVRRRLARPPAVEEARRAERPPGHEREGVDHRAHLDQLEPGLARAAPSARRACSSRSCASGTPRGARWSRRASRPGASTRATSASSGCGRRTCSSTCLQ